MISGINLEATVDYTLRADKDNPTVWKLGCIPSSAMGEFASEVSKGDYMKQMISLVRRGLKGWDNFDIKYETDDKGLLKSEILDKIPLNVIVELGGRLLEDNQLSKIEVKN